MDESCRIIFRVKRKKIIYSIYYGNESASSSVNDVDRYVIIRKLLDSILNVLQYTHAGGKFRHVYTAFFFRKFAYSRYDVP
jgi:hypothetical protein